MRKCPPGVLCIENLTSVFFTIIIIIVGYFIYISYSKNHSNSKNNFKPNRKKSQLSKKCFTNFLAFGSLFIKIFFCLFTFIWVRASLPRYRYDQLMSLGWKTFLPVSIGWLFFSSSILICFNFLSLSVDLGKAEMDFFKAIKLGILKCG